MIYFEKLYNQAVLKCVHFYAASNWLRLLLHPNTTKMEGNIRHLDLLKRVDWRVSSRPAPSGGSSLPSLCLCGWSLQSATASPGGAGSSPSRSPPRSPPWSPHWRWRGCVTGRRATPRALREVEFERVNLHTVTFSLNSAEWISSLALVQSQMTWNLI